MFKVFRGKGTWGFPYVFLILLFSLGTRTRYQLSEWAENAFPQTALALIYCNRTCFG